MKKLIAQGLIVANLILAAAPECSSANDAAPVVSCSPPKGYVKAGRAAKAAKGQFYFCLKNTKTCTIIWKFKGEGAREHAKVMYDEGFATVPKNAKSWRTTNCGAIYKNDLNT